LRGIGFARDIIVLTPEEFDRDRLSQAQLPGRLHWKGELSMKPTDTEISHKFKLWPPLS
jgi:hypothetical protein